MLIRKNHGHQGQLGVYRCPFCGFWHVGHIPEETALAQAGDKTVLTSNKGGAV
ncbi:hypothetical protein GTGU_04106 [Trabulsiella guamensis ATCC 49490]|uniref:Uncharacterized protein n=2 Tax=Trabulsiella guamensis TaxID=158852 RepID=A0A084ZQC3_9ENTR|nr:hypothetical protein GTGU_04106 [Trabulsiella guamensis ATCC 49490]